MIWRDAWYRAKRDRGHYESASAVMRDEAELRQDDGTPYQPSEELLLPTVGLPMVDITRKTTSAGNKHNIDRNKYSIGSKINR